MKKITKGGIIMRQKLISYNLCEPNEDIKLIDFFRFVSEILATSFTRKNMDHQEYGSRGIFPKHSVASHARLHSRCICIRDVLGNVAEW